ncbi:MAG: DNA double-strand break repair nuclease NurA [Pyrobaculum sp.]
MRQLLSELLRLAELELLDQRLEVSPELFKLVNQCDSGFTQVYYAVDSGYAVLHVGGSEVLIQSIVAVGTDVRRRFVAQLASGDVHIQARLNEIHFAESLQGLVLVDGPLTPYVSRSRVVGVSKDPRLVRYGPRIGDERLRALFVKASKALGERRLAALILAQAPRGAYLEPVEVGDFYGTFFKSDWVLYVEFPKWVRVEELCSLLRRYPLRLRIAHHLAKVNKKYLYSLRFILANVLRPLELSFRDVL